MLELVIYMNFKTAGKFKMKTSHMFNKLFSDLKTFGVKIMQN